MKGERRGEGEGKEIPLSTAYCKGEEGYEREYAREYRRLNGWRRGEGMGV